MATEPSFQDLVDTMAAGARMSRAAVAKTNAKVLGAADLATIIAEGTMRAGAIYIAEKHLAVDHKAVTARMRDIVRAEYAELLATLEDALAGNMGGPMYRQIINTYCTSWAIRAVDNRGK